MTYAGDWPQWRGATQDGHAVGEELADSWPATGPPVLWTRELGQGYSSFVVVNDRAYTQGQSLYEQTLLCLDANTGETLWSHKYGWTYEGGGLYPGPRATPAVADGRVYFAAPDGLVGCVDADTGASIWSTNLKKTYDGKGTDFGTAASPVVWQGKVIVPVGGAGASLVAVDAKSGEVVWKCGDGPASYATPLVISFAGRSLVVAPLENSVLCADAETGAKQWELELSSGYDEHSASPLYRKPFLMFSAPFKSGAKCYRLVAEGAAGCRTEPVWESLQMSNDIASSVLVGEQVLGFDLREPQSRLHRPSRGEFRCLDWNDGKTLWSSKEPGHANAIVGGDKLLLFNDRGELRLARVSSDGYQELASSPVLTDEICWTPPALSDGRVFLRSQSRAVCLFVGKGTLPTGRAAQTVESIPRASRFDPTVLLGGEREFPAATPERPELVRWFWWTSSVIGIAWLLFHGLPAAFGGLVRRRDAQSLPVPATARSTRAGRVLYWIALVAAGAVGSAVVNPRSEGFLFTWPLAVWALMQLAAEQSVSAVRMKGSRAAAWRARAAIALFAAGCGLFFHACRLSGLATEWAFLTGFVTAGPMALLWRLGLGERCRDRAWVILPAHLCEYTIYFWSSVAFMSWRLHVGS